jgi:hypothetical protein
MTCALDVVVEFIALLVRIWKISGQILGLEIGYPD